VISPFATCLFVILALGLLGLPIGYSMIAGSIVYLLLANLDLGTSAEQILNGLYNSYVLLAVPLFLFSAELMNVSKMTDHLLRFCDMLVGRFRGGLGHINIVQSIIFAGMSGSAIADLAATGRISIDMMTRNNRYTVSYAAAITAASAVIGPIIPPSIPMVLYALISDTSVGYLFLGGVIPGLLMALAQMVINTIQAHRHDFPVEKPIPLREWPGITATAIPALLMPVILLGGIYGGVMTPTEAAAVAAAYAFAVAVLWYRNVTARETYVAMLNSALALGYVGAPETYLAMGKRLEFSGRSGAAAKLYSGYLEAKYTEAVWDRHEAIDRPIPTADIAVAAHLPLLYVRARDSELAIKTAAALSAFDPSRTSIVDGFVSDMGGRRRANWVARNSLLPCPAARTARWRDSVALGACSVFRRKL